MERNQENLYPLFSGYKHEGIWAKIGQGNVGKVQDRDCQVKLFAKVEVWRICISKVFKFY